MRRNREPEILEFLAMRREGFTWRELISKHSFSQISQTQILRSQISFPRKTLDRHLKALIKKALVEKILERRKDGEKGRQSTRYRIRSEFWHKWGCLSVSWPARRIGSTFFLGQERKRASGKKYVRLFPEEKRRFEELKVHLKKRRAAIGL